MIGYYTNKNEGREFIKTIFKDFLEDRNHCKNTYKTLYKVEQHLSEVG